MMGPCTCEARAGGKGGGLLSQDKRGKSWDSKAYGCRERKQHASFPFSSFRTSHGDEVIALSYFPSRLKAAVLRMKNPYLFWRLVIHSNAEGPGGVVVTLLPPNASRLLVASQVNPLLIRPLLFGRLAGVVGGLGLFLSGPRRKYLRTANTFTATCLYVVRHRGSRSS